MKDFEVVAKTTLKPSGGHLWRISVNLKGKPTCIGSRSTTESLSADQKGGSKSFRKRGDGEAIERVSGGSKDILANRSMPQDGEAKMLLGQDGKVLTSSEDPVEQWK